MYMYWVLHVTQVKGTNVFWYGTHVGTHIKLTFPVHWTTIDIMGICVPFQLQQCKKTNAICLKTQPLLTVQQKEINDHKLMGTGLTFSWPGCQRGHCRCEHCLRPRGRNREGWTRRYGRDSWTAPGSCPLLLEKEGGRKREMAKEGERERERELGKQSRNQMLKEKV